MKRNLFLTAVLIALFTNAFNAQTTFDFESLVIPENGYWNGSDESGFFGNSEITFSNSYNSTYQSWSEFSYAYDTITSDVQYALYTQQREAFSGNIFGVGFVPSDWEGGTYDNIPIKIGFDNTKNISSIYIANDSTTVDIIVNGNSYGTEPFSDGDYFKILISGINGTTPTNDTIKYYLADYRNGQTLILNDWKKIDLSSLGAIDTLVFNLESSDVGSYGMNTPAYFCMDNITYTSTSSIENTANNNINIYPNPAKNVVNIKGVLNANISVNDITGKTVYSKNNCSENEKVNVSNLNSGIYFIRIEGNKHIYTKKLIVK